MLFSRSLLKRIMGAAHAQGPKLCEKCFERKPRDQVRAIVSPDGLRQRWICSDCTKDGDGAR